MVKLELHSSAAFLRSHLMQYTVCAVALFVALSGNACIAQPSALSSLDTSAADSTSTVGSFDKPTIGSEGVPHLELFVAEGGHRAARVSGKKAFALSLLLPGLGHRYVHGGDWDGWASVFAVTDASLWVGLLGSEWRRNHLVDSYTTLAAAHAGAEVDGKERDFFLNLASYTSSDEYTEVQLRNRNWAQVDYAADPAYQWSWESEERYDQYRDVREDAESLRRRRTFIVTTLVANRLIAGFTALRAAGRVEDRNTELSFALPPAGSSFPLVRLTSTF